MAKPRIFIGSLSFNITDSDLIGIFSEYGQVISASVIKDKMTHKSKGFGFVEMNSVEEASNAIMKLNNSELKGRTVFVDFVRSREEDFKELFSRRILKDDLNESTSQLPSEIRQLNDEIATTLAFGDVIPQITLSCRFNFELIQFLKKNKLEIYKLSSREFEEMVAEIWRGLQYDVIVTPETRDGGKDIIVIKKEETTVQYYIECKRFSPENKVTIGIVKNLHSTVISDRVTKGIIATTSSFTKDAIDFIGKNKWQLEGRDIEGIWNWVDLYLKTYRRIRKF